MVQFGHISTIQFLILYGSVFVSLIWLAFQYKGNKLALYIILLFSYGFFAYFGKNAINAYKIITLIYAIYLLVIQPVFVRLNNRLTTIILFFILFLVSFLISSLWVNNDGFFLTFAQLNRYIIPVSLFFVIRKKAIRNPQSLEVLNKLFFQLLFLQIIYTVIQLFVIGIIEQLCGVFVGGAVGTSIPLLGLLWLGLNSNLQKMERKHWLFMVGLLLSGVVTGKRAVWFMFPAVFLLYGIYVAKNKYPKQVMSLIFLTPLFIYIGFKLVPTLNPDHKIWGRFDVGYAIDYATDYSLGREKKSGERVVGEGRVGANKLLWGYITSGDFDEKSLFGYGSGKVYAERTNYRNADENLGVNSKGSLTGVFQFYMGYGLVGTLLFLGYYLLIFFNIKYNRLRLVFLFVALYDFIFYVGTTAREPFLSVFLLYLILYSGTRYESTGKYLSDEPFDVSWKNMKKPRKRKTSANVFYGNTLNEADKNELNTGPDNEDPHRL